MSIMNTGASEPTDEGTTDPVVEETSVDTSDKNDGKTFTQEQLNKIVEDRLRREKQTYLKEQKVLLEKAKKYDELEEQNKTELQKLQELAEAEKTRAAQAEERLRAQTLQNKILSVAADLHVIDVDVVQMALEKQTFEVGDDGQPIGVEAAVKELLAAKPYLVGKQTSSGKVNGGYRGTNGKDQLTLQDLKSMSPEEIDKAQSEGRFNDLYGVK